MRDDRELGLELWIRLVKDSITSNVTKKNTYRQVNVILYLSRPINKLESYQVWLSFGSFKLGSLKKQVKFELWPELVSNLYFYITRVGLEHGFVCSKALLRVKDVMIGYKVHLFLFL